MKFCTYLISLLLFAFITACVDKDFDLPPADGQDPNLQANATIADLKTFHVPDQYVEIEDDLIISALVISDDREGNFFKQLAIQDETGGIEIRIDVTNLRNVYPPGRRIFLKAKGLWISDYNGLIQLGAGTGIDDEGELELLRIPQSLVERHIIRGSYNHVLVPALKTIDQLTTADVSTLVQFDNVQFITPDAGVPYADAVLELSINHEIEDCSRQRIIIRTSGFARFASELTPTGGGSIVGVMGIFNDDFQLTIRDLADVSMNGERCASNNFTLAAVRNLFSQGTTIMPGGSVQGVVISDYNSQSVTGRNLYIQDATGGIVLRFTANHSFSLGAEIRIDVSGGLLGEFNGLLQIDGLSTGGGEVISQPGDVTPRDATVLEVLNNAQAWESTLIKISNATLSNNTVFNGEVTVTDATGSMVLFTRSQSTFANNALPTGEVSIRAIVSEFNIPQLIIRNSADVSGGGTGSQEIDESFTSIPNNTDINLAGWANIAVKGTRLWRAQVFSGNHYAQATSFNDTNAEMESWLITPSIELDVPKKITFESAKAFWTHDGLSVWISSDFNGSDVTSATWTPLSPVLAQQSDTEHEFIPSGDVDLSGFNGTVRIGFRYIGSGPGGMTTSCRIDNVKVEKL